MELTIAAARDVAETALRALGYDGRQPHIIASHLLDCELRGLGYAGLARILSVAKRLGADGPSRTPVAVARETAVSARLLGHDNVGYLVSEIATDIAIAKAESSGLSIVGASDTWYTGMLSFYAERAVARDLVVMIASNASPWVAPHGGTEGRFGTNPICFAFPSDDGPVIWDIGTAAITHAEAVLAQRLGRTLPEGTAFDAAGNPTRDPASALAGALACWGGHRGSGLALVVHLLGMLAGSATVPGELREFGFLMLAMQPDLLTSLAEYKAQVSAFSALMRETRPVAGGAPVRMPFERSQQDRAARIAGGVIDVPDQVIAALRALQPHP